MLRRLQKKWKVSGARLLLILVTFAVGGSLTGYAGRKLLNLFQIDQRWLWLILYIIIITILWPISVLLVSIFSGQFNFFRSYIRKIGQRMRLVSREESILRGSDGHVSASQSSVPVNLAIFASGAGSNAQKIIDYFKNSKVAGVALIVCNNPTAGVLKIAQKENIPVILIEKEKFFRGGAYLTELKQKNIGFIVLAGFLWKLPASLVNAYAGRIINIHPALLPNFGGKGMYGHNVHEAVLAAGDRETGITIHYVDEHYDNGDIIEQVRCKVLPGDTAGSIAERIHKLEHEYYPKAIERVVVQLTSS